MADGLDSEAVRQHAQQFFHALPYEQTFGDHTAGSDEDAASSQASLLAANILNLVTESRPLSAVHASDLAIAITGCGLCLQCVLSVQPVFKVT